MMAKQELTPSELEAKIIARKARKAANSRARRERVKLDPILKAKAKAIKAAYQLKLKTERPEIYRAQIARGNSKWRAKNADRIRAYHAEYNKKYYNSIITALGQSRKKPLDMSPAAVLKRAKQSYQARKWQAKKLAEDPNYFKNRYKAKIAENQARYQARRIAARAIIAADQQ